jgi:hypothetical protein
MSLLRLILILFIVFYFIRLVTRFILPSLFYNYMDDKMKEFTSRQKKQREREQMQAKRREGEVKIDYSPKDGQKHKPSNGDYVDYVEIKD